MYAAEIPDPAVTPKGILTKPHYFEELVTLRVATNLLAAETRISAAQGPCERLRADTSAHLLQPGALHSVVFASNMQNATLGVAVGLLQTDVIYN